MFSRATALLAMITTLVASPSLTSAGFVTTSGTTFQLDGKAFYIFGTNAYWVSEVQYSAANLKTIFTTMANNGFTVCRVWGFNDVTSASGVYYQSWSSGKATVNTGSTGLGYFDTVVAAAKSAGVKLVVPLVNNWDAYGGMDVYTKQLGGKYHDDFYTSSTIKAAFKAYIKTFVTRYKDNDTIMSWELANEARCVGAGGLGKSGSCTTKTITSWVSEISSYIKSVDSKHLVANGDEGFFNTNSNVYLYSGPDGVDFDANVKVSTIDYGTYHAYPDNWGVASGSYKDWGVQWIKEHVASGKAANKPVVMEEYGLKSKDAATYKAWSDTVLAQKSNMQYWQLGIQSLGTNSDEYTVYSTDSLFTSTLTPAAASFKAAK